MTRDGHSDPKILRTAEDVTPAILALAEDISDGWFPDDTEPIDWEDFLDRLADPDGHAGEPFDIEEYDNPAVRKIQRHIRKYRRA